MSILTDTTSILCEEIIRLQTELEKLSKLGNEPNYGNSIGNVIAQDALKNTSETIYAHLKYYSYSHKNLYIFKRFDREVVSNVEP